MLTLIFGLSHYLVLCGWVLVSYLIGRRLSHAATYHSLAEEIAISTTLGLLTLGYSVFGLALLGWLRFDITLIVIALLVLVTRPVWPRLGHGYHVLQTLIVPQALAAIKTISTVRLTLVACGMALPLLILPLYPPAAYDATMYHLPYARTFIEEGRLVFAANLRYPVFPQLNEMLFILGLMFYDDIVPQMFQFLAGLLVALTLYAAGQRFFSRRSGVWAAALWLGSPMVVWVGSSAYVDVGLTLFVTVGVYALGAWLQTRQTRWVALAGLFVGGAASSKYLGLFFVGIVLLVIGVVALWRRRPQPLALALVMAALVALPWYGRIVYFTGNPLFPFYTQVFGASEWSQAETYEERIIVPDESAAPANIVALAQRLAVRAFGRLYTRPQGVLWVPWRLAFDANFYGGEGRLPINPLLFFMMPLMLWAFIVNPRVRGVLILVFIYTLFWLSNWPVTRYFMPGLPFLCLAAAATLDQSWRRMGSAAVKAWLAQWTAFLPQRLPTLQSLTQPATLTLMTALFLAAPGSVYGAYSVYRAGPLPINHAEREAYLVRRLPLYAAYQFLNDSLDQDYTIYALAPPNFLYYVEGQLLGDTYGPARHSRIIAKLGDGQALYDELRGLGAEYFLTIPRYSMPTDAAFQQHFKPIYQSSEAIVYQLTVQPSPNAQ